MNSNRHRVAPPQALVFAIGLWAGQAFGAPAEPPQPTGGAESAPAAEPGRGQAPVEEVSADAGTLPRPVGDENPAAQCYDAARGSAGAAFSGNDATFACDLAVRMARDAASTGTGGNAAVIAALTNRALVLAGTGRLEPALEDLDAALAMAPDDVRLHGNRGNLLLRLGRLQDALAAHDRAVTLAPRSPEAYYNRAFVYRALGEPALAAEDVARARQLFGRISAAGTRGPAGGRDR